MPPSQKKKGPSGTKGAGSRHQSWWLFYSYFYFLSFLCKSPSRQIGVAYVTATGTALATAVGLNLYTKVRGDGEGALLQAPFPMRPASQCSPQHRAISLAPSPRRFGVAAPHGSPQPHPAPAADAIPFPAASPPFACPLGPVRSRGRRQLREHPDDEAAVSVSDPGGSPPSPYSAPPGPCRAPQRGGPAVIKAGGRSWGEGGHLGLCWEMSRTQSLSAGDCGSAVSWCYVVFWGVLPEGAGSR